MIPGIRVLTEFFNENMSRQFPLDTAATGISSDGSYRLPTELLVDACIMAPASLTASLFHLSRVTYDGQFATAYLGYDGETIGAMTSFPASSTSQTVYFTLVYDSVEINGSISCGMATPMDQKQGDWEFTLAAGKFSDSCVVPAPEALSGIVVDGVRYTGDVTLVAGENMVITAADVGGNWELTFTTSLPSLMLNPDAFQTAVVDRLVADGGYPVSSINTITPDNAGNITIKGGDGMTVDTGTYSITVNNQNNTPCCTKSSMDVIIANTDQLNQRVGILRSFQQQLDNRLNMMSSLLVSMQNNQAQR